MTAARGSDVLDILGDQFLLLMGNLVRGNMKRPCGLPMRPGKEVDRIRDEHRLPGPYRRPGPGPGREKRPHQLPLHRAGHRHDPVVLAPGCGELLSPGPVGHPDHRPVPSPRGLRRRQASHGKIRRRDSRRGVRDRYHREKGRFTGYQQGICHQDASHEVCEYPG